MQVRFSEHHWRWWRCIHHACQQRSAPTCACQLPAAACWQSGGACAGTPGSPHNSAGSDALLLQDFKVLTRLGGLLGPCTPAHASCSSTAHVGARLACQSRAPCAVCTLLSDSQTATKEQWVQSMRWSPEATMVQWAPILAMFPPIIAGRLRILCRPDCFNTLKGYCLRGQTSWLAPLMQWELVCGPSVK